VIINIEVKSLLGRQEDSQENRQYQIRVHSLSTCCSIIIHLYLLLYLLKQSLSRILAQIKIVAELLNDLVRVVIFEYFDLLDVLAVELNLQYTNRLFDDWQE